MYRSSSTTRFSDEFFSSNSSISSSAAMSSPNPKQPINPDLDHLPTYNPMSHVAKKEKDRLRSAENAVHLIPVLLVLCAIILWYFSSPVDLVNKSDSLVARVESTLSNSGVDHGHGKSSLETSLEQEHLDGVDQSTDSADPKTIT